MNSKRIYFLMIAGIVFLAGCKKEDAISKIDSNSKEIAPASPDAVAPTATPTTNPTQGQPQPQSPEAQTTTNVTMPPPNVKTTQLAFNKKEHDFGPIEQTEKVNYTFTFKNTGANDLIISSATGSCGCTVPEYPKQPIKPGKSGKMKVTFDPSGKTGMQSKTVTVKANTPTGTETLVVKASVKGGETKVTTTPNATTTTTVTPAATPLPMQTGEIPKQ